MENEIGPAEIRVDERISIRRVEPGDAADLFAVVDRNRQYLRCWLPWVDGTQAVVNTEQFIRQARVQETAGTGMVYVLRVNGTVAGTLGIQDFDRANHRTGLGYWLDEGQQGGGIMTSACRASIDMLFSTLGVHRVEIRCATGNARSCAIPRRLGFTYEGVSREVQWLYDHYVDHVIYGMLEQNWSKP